MAVCYGVLGPGRASRCQRTCHSNCVRNGFDELQLMQVTVKQPHTVLHTPHIARYLSSRKLLLVQAQHVWLNFSECRSRVTLRLQAQQHCMGAELCRRRKRSVLTAKAMVCQRMLCSQAGTHALQQVERAEQPMLQATCSSARAHTTTSAKYWSTSAQQHSWQFKTHVHNRLFTQQFQCASCVS